MLTINDLHMRFGGIRAVNGVSLTIEPGTITGLIGPNGAGKTTLFNVIAGLHKPTSGQVALDGEDITGLPPHALFHKGMLRTFQIAHEFSTLTVRENLMMVPPHQSGERLVDAWFRQQKIRVEEANIGARADEVIEFLKDDPELTDEERFDLYYDERERRKPKNKGLTYNQLLKGAGIKPSDKGSK